MVTVATNRRRCASQEIALRNSSAVTTRNVSPRLGTVTMMTIVAMDLMNQLLFVSNWTVLGAGIAVPSLIDAFRHGPIATVMTTVGMDPMRNKADVPSAILLAISSVKRRRNAFPNGGCVMVSIYWLVLKHLCWYTTILFLHPNGLSWRSFQVKMTVETTVMNRIPAVVARLGPVLRVNFAATMANASEAKFVAMAPQIVQMDLMNETANQVS